MSLTDPRAVHGRPSARRGVTPQPSPHPPSAPHRRIARGGRVVSSSSAPAAGRAVPFAPFAPPAVTVSAPATPRFLAKRRPPPFAEHPAQTRLYAVAKRALDIALSVLALLVLSPLFFLLGLLIWAEDRGPVFFSQERVGRGGVPFRFYKFRSMVRNADALKDTLIGGGNNEAGAVIFKMKRDPRCTRVGRLLRKYSLDELPQFFNVLRGEMSLVGPRPHLPREVAAYREASHHKRNGVTPGLLCLREVQGRSNLTFEQWIALDLLYIEHQGLRTDLWILIRALPAVLRAEGAC